MSRFADFASSLANQNKFNIGLAHRKIHWLSAVYKAHATRWQSCHNYLRNRHAGKQGQFVFVQDIQLKYIPLHYALLSASGAYSTPFAV